MFYVGQKQSQEETGAKALLTGGTAGSPQQDVHHANEQWRPRLQQLSATY